MSNNNNESQEARLKTILSQLGFSVYDKDLENFKQSMKLNNITLSDLKNLKKDDISKIK